MRNTYFIKYQVIDKLQQNFEFVGWTHRFALVNAENPTSARKLLTRTITKAEEPNHVVVRINTTIEACDDVVILPLSIEENTIVERKGYKKGDSIEIIKEGRGVGRSLFGK